MNALYHIFNMKPMHKSPISLLHLLFLLRMSHIGLVVSYEGYRAPVNKTINTLSSEQFYAHQGISR